MNPTLLIVDDEKASREGLRAALEERYDVYLAEDARTAADILNSEKVDVLLSDLRMPGDDGLKLIQLAKKQPSPPICVLMTAYGSEELAVNAMKQGADDYIAKGHLQLDELELRIGRLLKSRGLETENQQLRQQLDRRYGLHSIIGDSAPIRQVLETARQVASSRATILIEGESGTGKELIAQAIHQLSPRSRQRFVAVHCASLSSNLLESELFGHEKGAFTGAVERRQGRFELADGGTLFLDEIGEIDAGIQVKILRVLETRVFERVGGNRSIQTDARVIAATNRNLRQMTAEGSFRQDLFFRLNVIAIRMPPLRERLDDIPLLANHFLKEFNRENSKNIRAIEPAVLHAFLRYNWPGNIRELRNVINRMVVLCRGSQLTMADVPEELTRPGASPLQKSPASAPPPPDSLNLAEMEHRLIQAAMEKTGGNVSHAAVLLGISRRTLHRKLNETSVPSNESASPSAT
ncbi:MAG: sigma-54 dependent transcriptional regulator [Verrucomicrobiae bacterium]|nr:sigma-54 dependent transcriptional regulator [Verrucomicrobiae bacterium]